MNKYGAVRVEIDGIKFASKGEAARYGVLRAKLDSGEIADLRLQVGYVLTVNGVKLGRYIADFVYQRDGIEIVEDFKGMPTPLYRWKKRHMKAEHGIAIYEVTRPNAF